ncbi:MAG: PD-(D/E)XK nuclease family protein [Flavobacteriales bacterium]
MKSFLDQVVEKVNSDKTDKNLVFILPSKRAGIFLKESWIRYFKEKTIWIPQIWTIEEFMEIISGLKQLDSTTLLFEFYQAYSETHKTPESFENFLKWIHTIISDFNDLDRNLIDASKFFEYIASVERMDKWKPKELDYETDLIQKNLLFWEEMKKVYHRIRQNLEKQSFGYQGMIFRKAYEMIEDFTKKNKNHFVFTGFNALTKSEEKIIRYLKREQRASVFWDSDAYYLDDLTQESGMFLREIRKWNIYEKEAFSFVGKTLSQEKNIHLIGTPKQVGQVKLAGSLLQDLIEKGEKLNETAFVLADENLLNPALNAFPKVIEKVNVTMGYSLQNIPLSTFITSFLKLYVNYTKFDQKGLYYEDVLSFLKNTYTDYLLEDRTDFMKELVQQNNVFISIKYLSTFSEAFAFLFDFKGKIDAFQLVKKVQYVLQFLSKNELLRKSTLEMEYLFRFATIWENLSILVTKFPFVKELKILQTLYNQILFNETLSFYGEPLRGLQVMGMLETRLLDFKNIIITSLNEGILPKGKTSNTFIPFDIRKNVGLPTFQENDAIFAYHFYRLIQRAENVYLIYNTENDDYGSGEKSRFLTQLEIELPYKIKHHIAAGSIAEKLEKPLQIPKSPKMMKRLYEMAEKGFSPSSLNAYIRNPLTFYYQNVLELRDVTEIEETIEMKTLGTVVHNTLEKLYQPYVNEVLTIEIIQKLQKQFEKELQQEFNEVYKNGDYSKGKNLLIYSVSKRFIHNFLLYEKEVILKGNQIIIRHLEKELKASFDLNERQIHIRGFADRIDQCNGVTRIIDYKTGNAEANKLKLKDFDEVTLSKDYDKAMQLLLYIYMYHDEYQEEKISSGIISFRKQKEGIMLLSLNKNTLISKEDLTDFKPKLGALLEEILNEKIPIMENVEDN